MRVARQDRRQDPLTRVRVEYRALAERNWAAIQHNDWVRRRVSRATLALLALILVVQVALGVLEVVTLTRTSVQDVRQRREESARIAQNAVALMAVQQERYDNCLSQNRRHDRTLLTLRRVVRDAEHRQPEQARQIRQSVAGTILLIDALSPKLNCKVLVGRPRQ